MMHTGGKMGIIKLIKKGFEFLRDPETEIRIRMLFLLEYSTFMASLVGSIAMLNLVTSIWIIIPNLIQVVFSSLGLFFSHVKKKHEAAAGFVIIGGVFFSLPVMFFTAGGNESGMPLWFVLAAVFSCIMSSGKMRIITPAVSVAVFSVCMIIGYIYPDIIIPLKDNGAVFIDIMQSFVIICTVLCVTLIVYLSTYDNQRKQLEQKSRELFIAMNSDALTGVPNRHAYYNDIAEYSESGYVKNLVFAAMDLNGLKTVNDSFGHSAGDEFILDAAGLISEVLAPYGTIYRVGGDEFSAVLFCDDSEAGLLYEKLNSSVRKSDCKWADKLSISSGIVLWNENPEMSFSELAKLADEKMYQDKAEFYRKHGLERRKTLIHNTDNG